MSCTQEITRNNPSVQGLKDGVMWRARDSYAVWSQTENALTITGLTQYETLTLKTNSTAPQTFVLGTSTSKQATYMFSKDGLELNYATGVAMGDGEIVITEYDDTNHTVTGTFRFNAENLDSGSSGAELLNFIEGNFYKIPVVPSL